jgi:hypothetical protein
VVERECEFKPVLGKLAPGEERARVIDQDVDTWLLVSDLSRHAFHLGEACEISKMYRVGEHFRGYLSNAGRAARDDNSLASHKRSRPVLLTSIIF